MKRAVVTFLWITLILPALIQCEEATFFHPEAVYVVGLGLTKYKCGGAIWKNQDSPSFTDLEHCGNLADFDLTGGYGVTTSNGVVLVAGQCLGGPDIIKMPYPALWRDGAKEFLPRWDSVASAARGFTTFSYARDISVSGTDIFIAGTVYTPDINGTYVALPVLWKNGNPDTLKRIWSQPTEFSTHFDAVAVYSDGGNVVVAGIRRSNVFTASRTVYWLNNEPVLTDSIEGYPYSTPYDVTMLGKDVYVVGMIHHWAYYNHAPRMAAMWKNGELHILAADGVAQGIAVQGNDIYVVGSIGGRPVYWLNGVVHELPWPDGLSGSAVAIFIRNGDIFIAGNSYDTNNLYGGYWRNGLFYKLSDTFMVRDIVAKSY